MLKKGLYTEKNYIRKKHRPKKKKRERRLETVKYVSKRKIILFSHDGSDGKESACNAEDPGLIPGLGRCP